MPKRFRDRSSSYKIYYAIVIKNLLNIKGHQNPISGSEVTAILHSISWSAKTELYLFTREQYSAVVEQPLALRGSAKQHLD